MRIKKIIKFINNAIDNTVIIVLIMVLFIGVYGLYDSNQVYEEADLPERVVSSKPVGTDNEEQFETLRTINGNTIAWLTIDNTAIDYPVVQGEDDYEYLKKDFNGEYAACGSIFMDYQNSSNFSDKYTLIFGHHMSRSRMFGDLDKFKEKQFFDENQTGKLYTENACNDLYIFACGRFECMDSVVYEINKNTTQDLQNLNEYIKKKAMFYREDFEINESTRILSLSTCSGDATNIRFIVFALIK